MPQRAHVANAAADGREAADCQTQCQDQSLACLVLLRRHGLGPHFSLEAEALAAVGADSLSSSMTGVSAMLVAT